MSEKADSFVKFWTMLTQMTNNYIDGYSSILILDKLLSYQKAQPEKYVSYINFLNHLWGMSYQTAIMNLSNIIIDDKDSVNIYSLLRFYQTNLIQENDSGAADGTHRQLHVLTRLFPCSSEIYLGIKELRDKYIAHIDKNRLLNPIEYLDKPSLTKIKQVYERLGVIFTQLIAENGINTDLINYEQIEKIGTELKYIFENLPIR